MIRLEDGRYVAPEDDSPEEAATLADTPEARLSLSRLTLRRFAQHRLGLISALFLLTCYLLLPLVGFIAPYGPNTRDAEHIFAPPQLVRVLDEGGLTAPYIYPLRGEANLAEYRWDYTPDRAAPQTLQWFCPGDPYSLAGLIPSTTHLFCAPEGETVFLWGSDRLGRDVFSRILYGAQLSLTVGLVGIAISMGLGIFFGSIAGYFGGGLDYAIQRLIEILRSIPELPLWLALSAAVPSHWGPVSVFFAISIILGLLDWPGLARAVRAKFFSLREEDFVQAAEMMGAKPSRIIRRHLLPNFRSHLIASAALSIPSMILGETALSFLGLGLRAPAVSWGVMLNDAQHLSSIEIYPWTALPMLPIIIVVLAFSFMGDGLRDALDPHRS